MKFSVSWAAMLPALELARQKWDAADARLAALSYVSEAFAEAVLDGIGVEALSEAALCAALRELVAARGEDFAAQVAGTLENRVRQGEFTVKLRQ